MNKAQRWIPRFIYLPLAAVPCVYLVVMLIRYAVDVPFLDGWELVPLLEKLNHHTLTPKDLWVQHNEHRLIFPQIVMLALAKMSSWSVFWEVAASFVIALGTFVFLAKQVEVTGRAVGNRWIVLVLPVVAVQIFTLRQWPNWIWGWQLQMFMNALAVVGSVYYLANPPFGRWRFAMAIALAIVATYSFANGMLIWPIGIALVAMAPHYAGKLRWRCLGVWGLLGAITAASYLYQYHKPVEHPPLDFILKNFRAYMDYVFWYMGRPAASLPDPSWNAGVAITLLTPVTLFLLLWRRYVKFGVLVPYIGICLYVFGSALVTGLGRAAYGANQGLVERYNTYCVLLWSCNLVFLMLLALGRPPVAENTATKKRKQSKPESSSTVRIVLSALALASLAAIIIQTGQASLNDVGQLAGFSDTLKAGQAQVVRMLDWNDPTQYEQTIILYPRVNTIVPRAKIMAKEHWSLFRNGVPKDAGGSY